MLNKCIFYLDLIQSRKETRQQKSLNSKLTYEMERQKAQFCDIITCTNDKEKSLCPDKCNKGNQFDYECNSIYFSCTKYLLNIIFTF